MKKEMYCQCRFKKGNRTTTGFIPQNKAKLNWIAQLEVNGVMEDGWQIMSVGNPVAKDRMKSLQNQKKGLPSILNG